MTPRTNRPAYKKVVEALKRRRGGMTAADVAAATALPLPAARELVNQAADEFQGRLEVTESSEILYSFPRGFTSRYRSLAARLGRFGDKFLSVSLLCLTTFFKVWILVTLFGYFALFMLIALAALTLSFAGGSSNSNNRSRGDSGGGFVIATHIFDLIIRLWFYSELTRSMEGSYRNRGAYGRPAGRTGQPLHKAVFSFVFGEKDPNRDAEAGEKQALIAHVSSNRGILSLPEYMAVTGLAPREAEGKILAFCAEFGGSPEATEEGTIIYRFQDILLRSGRNVPDSAAARQTPNSVGGPKPQRSSEPQQGGGPWRRLRAFSTNSKKLNTWFGIVNSVNLFFGGYFFYQALNTGIIGTTEQLQASPRLYGITYALASAATDNPHPILLIGLGLIPLLFSALFWLIPALRFARLNRENQAIKKRNLRKFGFFKIWEKPRGVSVSGINATAAECRPRDLEAEEEKIIVEMGSYSQPEVEVVEGGAVYNFTELEREKEALAAERAKVNPRDFDIGKVVFDSE
jgi:hypothetical protein